MPIWMGVTFQDSNGPFLSHLSFLNDHVMMVMLMVVIFIFYLLCYLIFYKSYYKFFSEATMVESIWSVIPALLLLVLVLPSMQILYMMEDVKTPSFSFKIVGHQWYWSYISPLLNNLSFHINGDTYMFHEFDSMMDLESHFPRVLGCSSSLTIPFNYTSRFLVSSSDVIHSFSIPSLALKVDALPGRVNQIFTYPSVGGVFFGQCSEICGSNHSFMPIMLKVVDLDSYNNNCLMTLLEEVLEIDSLKL